MLSDVWLLEKLFVAAFSVQLPFLAHATCKEVKLLKRLISMKLN